MTTRFRAPPQPVQRLAVGATGLGVPRARRKEGTHDMVPLDKGGDDRPKEKIDDSKHLKARLAIGALIVGLVAEMADTIRTILDISQFFG